MKNYKVYYIIKKHGHGYLNETEVTARNQREAIREVRQSVRTNTGRNAFHCTTHPPIKVKRGVEYDGMIYSRYDELFHTLW